MPSLGAMDPEAENLSMVREAAAAVLAHALPGEEYYAVRRPGMCEFPAR